LLVNPISRRIAKRLFAFISKAQIFCTQNSENKQNPWLAKLSNFVLYAFYFSKLYRHSSFRRQFSANNKFGKHF
jgi:hypothetical protein